MASRLTPKNHAELEEQGWTIVPAVYSRELCAALRDLMCATPPKYLRLRGPCIDSLLGPLLCASPASSCLRTSLTIAIRSRDDILGPSAELVPMWWQQDKHDREGDRHVIERCLEAGQPIITTQPCIHNIRHPICGAGAAVMAQATCARSSLFSMLLLFCVGTAGGIPVHSIRRALTRRRD